MTSRILPLPTAFIALFVPGTLAAQESPACDSLDILSVQYGPFAGNEVQVTVSNPSNAYFSYPMFSLVDAQGDTLVQEWLNFFGIGVDTVTHNMPPVAGASAVTTPFSGTLVLQYMTVNGTESCTWPITADLCPPAPCGEMQVYVLAQGGGPPVNADFNWEVVDANGTTAASGTMSMDTGGWQMAAETTCLPIGSYTLQVSQNGNVGTMFAIGVTQDDLATQGPSEALQPGGSAEVDFDFYPACANIGQGVQDHVLEDAPLLALDGRLLRITDPKGLPLGRLGVLDSAGRLERTVRTNSSTLSIDLQNAASGLYLLRPMDDRAWPVQRFVLH